MKKILLTLTLVALVSNAFAKEQTKANPTHRVNDIILTMDDDRRKAAFKNSILSSNNTCKNITNMVFHEVKDNKAYWYVDCSNKKYEVYVRNDATGTTRVTSCTVLYLAGKKCYFNSKK